MLLLYLIWTFLVGSIVLMIGVMVYNEWFAPQTLEAVSGEAMLSPIVTTGSEFPAPALAAAESSSSPSRKSARRKAPARKAKKPAARKAKRR